MTAATDVSISGSFSREVETTANVAKIVVKVLLCGEQAQVLKTIGAARVQKAEGKL